MPAYFYKAKARPGELVEGTIEADDLDQAVSKVMAMGYAPIDVMPDRKGGALNISSSKQRTKQQARAKFGELASFTRQLSDLTDSGVPIIRCLQVLSQQTRSRDFRDTLDAIRISVQDGNSLSKSMAAFPAVFSPLYVNMVRAGEVSGQLPVVLERLADLTEKEQETRSKVTASLVYPGLILLTGILTVFVLLSFVIPRLTVLFADLAENLPLPTVILLAASQMFSRFWWLILAGVVLVIYGFRRFAATTEGRLWLDGLKLRIPVIGPFIRDVEVARFARTLGTLLESGVVIMTALDAVSRLLSNTVLRKELAAAAVDVAGGSSLTAAIKRCAHMPAIAVDMVAVGEESGQLSNALQKLAVSYEKQADRLVKTLTSLLEPVLIIVIGSLIGFIVLALLLPIFRMNLIIQ